MDVFSRRDLRELMTYNQKPCVSMTMRTTRGAQYEDQIRWKNLVRHAEELLVGQGMRSPDVRELLRPAQLMHDDARFWRTVSEGLAGFLAPGLFRTYRVPLPLADEVLAGDTFNVKPMVPLFSGEGRFFVLILNQRRGLKLLECTQHTVHEMDLEQMPEAVNTSYEFGDESPRPSPGNPPKGGPVRAVHGFDPGGITIYHTKNELKEYFHQVDRGLRELLRDDTAPLVLSGEAEHIALYHQSNSYGRLMPGGFECHPDQWSFDQHRDRAWAIVQTDTRQAREKNVALYRQLGGTGRTANRVEEIVTSAYQGGVQILFAGRSQTVWGRIDPSGPHVTLHDRQEPGSEDLVNFAVVHTLTHGGQVYAVDPTEMPDGNQVPLAAIHWLPLGERSSKRAINEPAGQA